MKAYPLFTNSESRALDRYAHDVLGYPQTTLMGMAALSVFHANEDLWSTAEEIWMIVGTGGNGGDGYALANILHEEGHIVRIFKMDDPKREDSQFYASLCNRAGIEINFISALAEVELEVEPGSILLVDAILGTGFQGILTEDLLEIIEWINESSLFFYKLSLDSATGFQAGLPESHSIEADSIEELGTRKWENIGFTIDEQIVPRYYESIGFPIRTLESSEVFSQRYYWEKADIDSILPFFKRKATSHKYTNGAALFYGGSLGMQGAILLSSSIFQHLGGGITKVYTPEESTRDLLLQDDPSRMVTVGDGSGLEMDPFYKKAKAIVVGPGLTKSPDFLNSLTMDEDQTLVIDAGAIPDLGAVFPNSGSILLTPHAGEFERLTGVKCNSIQSAYQVALPFCTKHNVNILFKSFVSLLVTNDGLCFVWESPNAMLATMGTGDLLTGIIARFLSIGHDIPNSVYFALSFLDSVREMPETYPTAGDMLKYLKGKL